MSQDLFHKWSILIGTVRCASELGVQVGHTLVQKAVYLLQAAEHADVGYDFKLYHYGPYSEQLWNDLRLLSDVGALRIDADENGYGYWISLGSKAEVIERESKQVPTEKIRKVTDALGGAKSWDLELVATTHFVFADLGQRKRTKPTDSEIADIVVQLKPHFGPADVYSALALLQERGWLA